VKAISRRSMAAWLYS